MREYETPIELVATPANDNGAGQFTVVIFEDTGPMRHDVGSRIEAEALVQQAKSVGFNWTMCDDLEIRTHG